VSPEDKKVILSLENIPPEVAVDKSTESNENEAKEEFTDDNAGSRDISVDEFSEIESEETVTTENKSGDSENKIEGDDEAEK
jgi:hypothetical protein